MRILRCVLVCLILLGVWAASAENLKESNLQAVHQVAAAPSVRELTHAAPIEGKVLLFTDVSETSTSEIALDLLGVFYEVFRNEAAFVGALNKGGWDLVVVECPITRHDYSSVVSWVKGGGRLLLSVWDASKALFEAVEVKSAKEYSSPMKVYAWDPSSPLLTAYKGVPLPLTPSSDQFWKSGDLLDPVGDGMAVAGHTTAPTSGQAAVVVANDGRTVVNGFLFENFRRVDQDKNGIEDIVEFVANQLAYLLGAYKPPTPVKEVELEPGVTITDEIPARGFLTVEGDAATYVQYSLKVTDAAALAVEVSGSGPLAIHIRVTRPVNIEITDGGEPRVTADTTVFLPGGEGTLVLTNLQKGARYWILVENRNDGPLSYALTAYVAPVTLPVSTEPMEGMAVKEALPFPLLRFVTTESGTLVSVQRFFKVEEAQSVQIAFHGEGAWCLHLRRGSPVEARGGVVVSDLVWRINESGELMFEKSFLSPGTYFLAVEALDPPQTYRLTVGL